MKLALALIASMFLSMTALANEPVTKIQSFQCHPRGARGNLMVWTEKTVNSHVLTLGVIGEAGVEGIEKFTATRVHLDDIVVFTSKDETLKVAVSNDFDGEFFAGDLTLVKGGIEIVQELACEEFTTTPAGLL